MKPADLPYDPDAASLRVRARLVLGELDVALLPWRAREGKGEAGRVQHVGLIRRALGSSAVADDGQVVQPSRAEGAATFARFLLEE